MNIRISSGRLLLFAVSLFIFSACRTGTTPPSNQTTSNARVPAIRVSAPDIDAAEPAITSDAEANLYVVYVEHSSKTAADVFLQKYDKGLIASSDRIRINPDTGMAKAWRGDPPTAAIGPDGSVYIGWTRAVETKEGSGNDLLLSVSHDGGKSFAAPVKVNDDAKPASHGMHSLAVDKDGHVYLAWLDERDVKMREHADNLGDTQQEIRPPTDLQFVKVHHNSNKADPPNEHEMEATEPNSEVYFVVSADGGKTFSANKKLASDVCPCCKTSMLAAADGALYVSWRQVLPGDFRHIAVASTRDKGATFSKRTIVSDDKWKINACPVSGAAMSNGAKNVLNVFWYTAGDAGPAGLYLASSRDGGRTFDPRRTVDTDGSVSGMPVAFDESGVSTICLFGLYGDRIKTHGVAEFDSQIVYDVGDTIADASSPAATRINGKIYTAFVRTVGDTHSIWLSPIH